MNQEEIELDGKTYVSSKRAAQLSQYAQDYIGQLCRAGSADCRRVSGLWYVTLQSLESHKEMSAEVKSQAFSHTTSGYTQKSDTMLSFSGEDYVSSKHGAEITGYNPDYITQLARAGAIQARQVGSRWYVSRKELLANKDKNDALLAEVQAKSVGINRTSENTDSYIKSREHTTTTPIEESDLPLMPAFTNRKDSDDDIEEIDSPYGLATPITIKKNALEGQNEPSEAFLMSQPTEYKYQKPVQKRFSQTLILALTVVFILGVGSIGYFGIKKAGFNVSRLANSSSAYVAMLPNFADANPITRYIATALADILHYERIK
jgi:hypothetical protein